jgi:WD40 repeat protein
MPASIKWSANPKNPKHFLIADSKGSRFEQCQFKSTNKSSELVHDTIAIREIAGGVSAFDWSPLDSNLIALGTETTIKLVRLQALPGESTTATRWTHSTRRTNAISYSISGQVVCGLERARLEGGVQVYDTATVAPNTPLVSFAYGEAITGVRADPNDANMILAGSPQKGLRLFDIRGKCHHVFIDTPPSHSPYILLYNSFYARHA